MRTCNEVEEISDEHVMKKMIQAKSLLLLAVLIVTGSSELAEQDKDALRSIRGFLLQYNPQSPNLKQWLNNSGNPCIWLGIECSNGRVRGLNLSNFNLSGLLPPALANLTAVSSITLRQNHFGGAIPQELSRPLSSSLRHLDLSFNRLTGEIPSTLFSNCSQLTFLNLSSNGIVGRLPGELKNCPNLQKLALSRNNLTGAIPEGFLDNCMNLTHVDLEFNNLTGNIPEIHVNCSSLTELWLSHNNLTGLLPKGLGALSKMKTLVLGKNGFTGAIPPELSRLKELELLSIDNNLLEGPIPPSLGQMVSLQTLILHKNRLNGGIPKELSSLANLSILNLNNNNFTGTIPSELSRIRSLRLLFLGTNHLSGTIPPEIGNLTEVQGLDLSENRLSGPIPATISNLQSLLWFAVSENNLDGQLPPEIVNCSSLVWLNVADNQLSGPIPLNIGRIGAEANKTFNRNKENPPFVPRIVGGCWAMSRWFPQNYPFIYDTFRRSRCNQFWTHILQGTMPNPICIKNPNNHQAPAYIQLSGNRFTGTIPESLANHSRLGALILADNHLSGQIPEAISALSDLYYLNLSYNSLSGSIPENLGRLSCLDMLDLRNNNLSGMIPGTLANLTSLSTFNVSYNAKLRGPVPMGGQFLTFNPESYTGDSLLSGILPNNNSNHNSSSNPAKISSSNNPKNWVIRGICILAAVVVTSIAISTLCLCRRRDQGSNLAKSFDDIDALKRTIFSVPLAAGALTYDNIVKATDNFSESRCIGRGGQGVVYRAELAQGFHVAIKRLCHEDAEADIEFLAELQTLGGLSHPNLVPLLGCCLRGNQRIFVYKLIENGSLEEWLHEPTGLLEWPRRIKIALGCSSVLKFLHHECPSVIIHRDIKASNVLLDGSFNAFVTDFGLARNQSTDMTHVSTVVAGTLGYVPPEYSYTLKATTKGDVYSFGVVLMQLVTGLRAIGVDDELEGGLVAWVNSSLDRRSPNIFDPRVVESDTWDAESGLRVLRLACLCTAESPELRPNMVDVAATLQEISECLYSSSTFTPTNKHYYC